MRKLSNILEGMYTDSIHEGSPIKNVREGMFDVEDMAAQGMEEAKVDQITKDIDFRISEAVTEFCNKCRAGKSTPSINQKSHNLFKEAVKSLSWYQIGPSNGQWKNPPVKENKLARYVEDIENSSNLTIYVYDETNKVIYVKLELDWRSDRMKFDMNKMSMKDFLEDWKNPKTKKKYVLNKLA